MFPIFLEPKRRDGMREALARKGVQTSVHFNPIHLDPYWRKTFGYRSGHCPVAERLGLGEITLPLHLKLTAFQQERVIALVREVMMA
jgi:dTDP-4-amino-4,6-dideoxygalactose transaminase